MKRYSYAYEDANGGDGYGVSDSDEEVDGSSDEQVDDFQSMCWQKRFEEALECPDERQRNRLFNEVTKSFVTHAKWCGAVIISEVNLEDSEKSIKPSSFGGVAGGSKYLACGILFKFAQDVELSPFNYLYGGSSADDAAAAKAAGHERKSLSEVLRAGIKGVDVPLVTIIDFLGYRLSAFSTLPIAGQSSLVMGSADGGLNVAMVENNGWEEKACSALSTHLSLAPHKVMEGSSGQLKTIAFPIDIEIHKSLQDAKRLYVIDTARLMPPVAPLAGSSKREVFYKLFRPEFLAWYKDKAILSSDALSRFGQADKSHNAVVKEATRVLYEERIPQVAAEMQQALPANVMRFLQHRGVNLRFMGRVRGLVSNEALRRSLLEEMCSRVVQKRLFKTWRTGSSRVSPVTMVVEVVNCVLNGSCHSWMVAELRAKYGDTAITQEEAVDPLSLMDSAQRWNVVRNLHRLAGVSLDLEEGTSAITESDVTLEPRVKGMAAVSMFTAEAYRLEAKHASSTKKQQLLKKATLLLEEELVSYPHDPMLHLRMMRILSKTEGTCLIDTSKSLKQKVRFGEATLFVGRSTMRHYYTALANFDVEDAVFSWAKAFRHLSVDASTLSWPLLGKEKGEKKMAAARSRLEDDVYLVLGIVRTLQDCESCLHVRNYLRPLIVGILEGQMKQTVPLRVAFSLGVLLEEHDSLKVFFSRSTQLDVSSLGASEQGDDWYGSIRHFWPSAVNLTDVRFRNTHVSSAELGLALAQIPNLTHLSLERCYQISQDVLEKCTTTCHSWEIIACPGFDHVTCHKNIRKLLVKNCPHFSLESSTLSPCLETLILRKCQAISRETLKALPQSLTHLVCVLFDYESVVDIPAAAAANLTQLELDFVSDKSFPDVRFPVMPALEVLRICRVVTVHALNALLLSSPKLSKLSLYSCSDVREPLVELKNAKSLRHVDFRNCNILDESIAGIELETLICLSCANVTISPKFLPNKLKQVKCFAPQIEFLQGLFNLHTLELTSTPSMSDSVWENLWKSVGLNLDTLALRSIEDCTDSRLARVLQLCPKLKSCELESLPQVSGNNIGIGCKLSLTRLVIKSCLTDDQGLNGLLSKQHELTHLSLLYSPCPSISVLAKHCEKLEHLKIVLVDSGQFKSEEVLPWFPKMQNLVSLHLALHMNLALFISSCIPSMPRLTKVSLVGVYATEQLFSNLSKSATLGQLSLQKISVASSCASQLKDSRLVRVMFSLEPSQLESVENIFASYRCIKVVELIHSSTGEILPSKLGLRNHENALILEKDPIQCTKMVHKLLQRNSDTVDKDKWGFMICYADTFGISNMVNLRSKGVWNIICGVPKGITVHDELSFFGSLRLELDASDGIFWVDIDESEMDKFRADIERIAPKIDVAVLVWPFTRMGSQLFESVALTKLQDRAVVDNALRELYIVVAQITGALHDLLLKSNGPRVAYLGNGLQSISLITSASRYDVRAAEVARYALCATFALEMKQVKGIVSCVAIGPFAAGLRLTDDITPKAIASRRLIDTLFALTEEHNGKVVSFAGLKVIPP